MKKIRAATVWLSMPELHKDIIAEFIKRAEKDKFKRINFIFGNGTTVKFSINL